jgi:hypothetical protein
MLRPMIAFDGPDPAARLAALERFVERWYGASSTLPKPRKPLQPVLGCPAALERWLRVATAGGRHRGVQNQLVDPRRLDDAHEPFLLWSPNPRPIEPAPRWWVFYVENQGVVTWACEEEGDDPVVWARSDFRPTYANAWVRESEPLSGVMIRAVFLEALYGARVGGAPGRMSREQLDAIQKSTGMRQLSLRRQERPLHFWPDVHWVADHFIVGVSDTEDPDEVEVTFGAQKDDALAAVEDLVDDPMEFGLC